MAVGADGSPAAAVDGEDRVDLVEDANRGEELPVPHRLPDVVELDAQRADCTTALNDRPELQRLAGEVLDLERPELVLGREGVGADGRAARDQQRRRIDRPPRCKVVPDGGAQHVVDLTLEGDVIDPRPGEPAHPIRLADWK